MAEQRHALAVSRRRALAALLAGGAGVLAGCGWDGHFNILGYTTRPNFDESIHTVYVPLFRNKVFQTGPYRGREKEITLLRKAASDQPPR